MSFTDEKITVRYNGELLSAEAGLTLSEIVGGEKPCGGHGKCGKCKVVARGNISAPCETELKHLGKDELEKGMYQKPLISAACPVCVELILIRFHELADNLIKVLPPLEISAKLAREKAMKETGLPSKDIGVFFISPCPAKMASTKTGFYGDSGIDGVIGMNEVCLNLMHVQQIDVEITNDPIAGDLGTAWATSGGEISNINEFTTLAADGIENVVAVLKELESGKLNHIDFVELNACPGGCVGGIFTIENAFVAKSKIHTVRKGFMKDKINVEDSLDKPDEFYSKSDEWQPLNVFKLDNDFMVAFRKMQQLEDIMKTLPGLDCGVCGAPSCRAFAEDVVNGLAHISQCPRKDNN